MRKGGLHKPLILDKYSAEDLNTGVLKDKDQDVKLKHINEFRARPDISREPAAAGSANPLRGEEQQVSNDLLTRIR